MIQLTLSLKKKLRFNQIVSEFSKFCLNFPIIVLCLYACFITILIKWILNTTIYTKAISRHRLILVFIPPKFMTWAGKIFLKGKFYLYFWLFLSDHNFIHMLIAWFKKTFLPGLLSWWQTINGTIIFKQALLDMYYLDNVETEVKHMIVTYFLLDVLAMVETSEVNFTKLEKSLQYRFRTQIIVVMSPKAAILSLF